MNYKKYMNYRAELGFPRKDFIDAGDLDLYGKFPQLEPVGGLPGHKNGNIHRCHLVEDFLRFFGLNIDKGLVAFSDGVRHSVETLMTHYADRRWIIAADNYPFYLDTADEMELSYDVFTTLEEGSLASLSSLESGGDILLTTYPLKPSGAKYSETDIAWLKNWLDEDDRRLLIIDAVYVHFFETASSIMDLFKEHERVVILYSLSKSFSAPKVAGFTFAHQPEIREAFKSLPRNDYNMKICYGLLNSPEGTQRRADVVALLQEKRLAAVKRHLIEDGPADEGYLFYVPQTWIELNNRGIMAVPASVYGSNAPGCIISTLSIL